MKNENPVRHAIDESLCGVRFNAQDMRSVLRATRSRELPADAPVKKRRVRLDVAFATAMAVLVLAPIGLFALRAQNTRTATIVAASGQPTIAPTVTAKPGEDIIIAPESTAAPSDGRVYSESDAIRVARACFEDNCDTSVFSFEEYTVSVSFSQGEGDTFEYIVNMNSIYDNGCTFRVIVAAPEGTIISYSTPRLATVPSYLNGESDEVQAWYEKYGQYLFTWPQSEQAEFSRRYEGGTLRVAGAGEITVDEAAAIASKACFETLGIQEISAYPVLYAECASSDGIARYQTYCFEQPITDVLPETYILVTLKAADGTVESVEVFSSSELDL